MAREKARRRPCLRTPVLTNNAPHLASTEHERLAGLHGDLTAWRRWGPYVAERSWGTVREDYSADGNAWDFLPHDLARSTAYRWGEDGLAGICDRYQILVFALALWNERDPILKERAFGLAPTEGNHGEDVKEYYFYLDSTPTHSYMKWLYKYPQRAYPYLQLIEENRRRHGRGREFELLDTGIFDDDRYFDVFVEYAKASAEDLVIRVTVDNRGPDAAPIHLLPHLWFRNTWAWSEPPGPEPRIGPGPAGHGFVSLLADDRTAAPPRNLLFEYRLGPRYLYAEAGGESPLHRQRDERRAGVWDEASKAGTRPYVKDAFHRHVIDGEDATNPARFGTKSCLHYRYLVPPRGSVTLRMRLTPEALDAPLRDVDAVLRQRRAEADEFYAAIHPPAASDDERLVQRQAFAGLLWTKQIYLFDVNQWLEGDAVHRPPPESRRFVRNSQWRHLNSMRILSMPDKWEFPWFAAWDLAFHVLPLALVDPEFAKEQLWLLLFEQFLHPSGQIPAYEWEFSDVNPPVHAWAVWRVYNLDRIRSGRADREFLEKCFHKLLINFAWWVNKVDRQGNNIFEGGFLGLDNIAVVDRSQPLPEGAILEQSDATGWMAMFCLNLMRIALELAKENQAYEGLATKFFQHYIYVGAAMKNMGGRHYQLWDEEDGFFYDVLRFPDDRFEKFRVRSLVGLIPLYAVERLEEQAILRLPRVPRESRLVPAQQAAHRAQPLRSDRAGRGARLRSGRRRRRAVAADAAADSGPGRVPLALGAAQPLQISRGPPLPLRGPGGQVRAGGGGREDHGRELELARPGLVPDDLLDDRVAAQIGQGVRPAIHRARAWPIGATGDAGAGGRGSGEPPDPHLHPRRVRAAAGPRGAPEVPGGPLLARSPSSFTSTSTPRPGRGWAPRTRPAGPGSWRPSSTNGVGPGEGPVTN